MNYTPGMLRLFPPSGPDENASTAYHEIEYPEPPPDRPYVVLNFVITLDGQSTLGTLGARGIGSDSDHRLMRELRATVDALMHGAGTVRADNFPPRVSDALAQRRVERGLAPQPLGSVVTGTGELEPDFRYFSGRTPLVFTVDAKATSLGARLGSRATVIAAGSEEVDLRLALGLMRDRFDVRTVLCEGGPRLARGLLAAHCLDELFVTIAPKVGSDRAALRLVEGPPFAESEIPLLDLLHVLTESGELYLRYRVRR